MNVSRPWKALFSSSVCVSALGYFVDVYDLLLFSIVRVPSLRAIGVPESELLDAGVLLINLQMAGLLLGGFIWGIWGDRRGRIEVLFASIALYSTANLLNAFVSNVPAYGVLRFLAGIGLAGELGLAVTLVTESLPRATRGYGSVVVAGVGLLGAAFAAWVSERFSWREAYGLGGAMGLALLAARVSMQESPLFLRTDSIRRRTGAAGWGSLRLLFSNRERVARYGLTITIGIPLWYTVGILITFSPEIARALMITGPVSAGKGILYCYGFSTVGDFLAGILCQRLKSRKKAIAVFMAGTVLGSTLFLTAKGQSPEYLYAACAIIGIAGGYWALFMVTAAEQFGTNLRATVTTSVPNLVRGAVIPLTSIFQLGLPALGPVLSAAFVGVLCLTGAYWALARLPETFDAELDRMET